MSKWRGGGWNKQKSFNYCNIYLYFAKAKEDANTHTQQSPSYNICFLLTSSSPLWTPGWYITECTRPYEHVCVAPNTGHKGVVNVGWVEGYVNIWCIDFSADSPSNLFTYTLFSLLLFDLSSPRLSFPFLSSPPSETNHTQTGTHTDAFSQHQELHVHSWLKSAVWLWKCQQWN